MTVTRVTLGGQPLSPPVVVPDADVWALLRAWRPQDPQRWLLDWYGAALGRGADVVLEGVPLGGAAEAER